MSDLSTEPATDVSPQAVPRRDLGTVLRDVAFVVGPFLVLGVAGAVVWRVLTTLPYYTTTKDNAVMDQIELAKQVSADGWYLVIALVGGLVAGLLLTLWRERDPLLTLLLVVAGSVLAAYVMLELGLLLGPADPKSVFPHAAVGQKVSLQLKPMSGIDVLAWPIGALAGALGVLWGTSQREPAAIADDLPEAPPR